MRDAIDTVLALPIGARFALHGRTFTVADYAGWSHYGTHSLVPVWNAAGRRILLTVAPGDRIEVQ